MKILIKAESGMFNDPTTKTSRAANFSVSGVELLGFPVSKIWVGWGEANLRNINAVRGIFYSAASVCKICNRVQGEPYQLMMVFKDL